MKILAVSLKRREERELEEARRQGIRLVREVNRSHILMGLFRGIKEDVLVEVLGVSRATIWRTKAAYLREGLKSALCDDLRSGAPRRTSMRQETEVVALACSQPPQGSSRWTVRLIAQHLDLNRETIRRMLKKTSVNLGAK